MDVNASEMIDRPVNEVFRFYALEPRPEARPVGPRNAARKGVPGADRAGNGHPMAVHPRRCRGPRDHGGRELEPDRSFVVMIREGSMESRGYATFRPEPDGRTLLTVGGDFPEMDERMVDMVRGKLARTVGNVKKLIENVCGHP